MRLRLLSLVSAVTVGMLAATVPATAHDTEEPVTSDETTPVVVNEDTTLVAHHYFPEGTDLQFQRREGRQRLDGRTVNGTRDYVFVGGDAKSHLDDGAVHVFDVTDPTAPVHLAEVPCPGYHAEIAVHENLLFQGIDSARSHPDGCEDTVPGAPENDKGDTIGVRVFDITDPARPEVIAFLDADDGVEGTHNMTVVPWADRLYLAQAAFDAVAPPLTIVDVSNRDFETHTLDLRTDIGSDLAADGCHDIGLDPERELAFCAAIENTLVWDISDPDAPEHVSTIVNPKISIHHGARLAPDGTTLVLNDEHAGAADINVHRDSDTGVGANGCLGDRTTGALWFYDVTNPELPLLQGSFAPETPRPTASPCTSHFYNFVPGTTFVVVGWYEAGIVVVDYADPTLPVEAGVFLPELGNFWAAYYWQGHLYGSSRTVREKGNGGGLWVVSFDPLSDEDHEDYDEHEGAVDLPPAPQDEGTSWGRWTPPHPLGSGPYDRQVTIRP